MRTSAPKLIRRPSRSIATSLLALLLLVVGGLGIWLCGVRLFDGAWPAGTTAAVNGFEGGRSESIHRCGCARRPCPVEQANAAEPDPQPAHNEKQ